MKCKNCGHAIRNYGYGEDFEWLHVNSRLHWVALKNHCLCKKAEFDESQEPQL